MTTPPSDLETEIRKAMKSNHRMTEEEVRRVMFPYNTRLAQTGVEGYVIAALIYDTFRGKINCYGRYLKPECIHSALNLSMGVNGSRTSGHISHPDSHEMNPSTLTAFVPAQRSGVKEDKAYVALVNIPIDPDEEVIRPAHYKPRSMLH